MRTRTVRLGMVVTRAKNEKGEMQKKHDDSVKLIGKVARSFGILQAAVAKVDIHYHSLSIHYHSLSIHYPFIIHSLSTPLASSRGRSQRWTVSRRPVRR